MTEAFIALGSNLGDRLATMASALRVLADTPGAHILDVSHVYESEPWGVTDQPRFANAVARVDWNGDARGLLARLQAIETQLGRTHGERFGPRPIDLDILLVEDEEWDAPDLTVPHPRLRERDFVVTPLLEIAPDVRMPDGSTIARSEAVLGRVTATMGVVPGFDRGV